MAPTHGTVEPPLLTEPSRDSVARPSPHDRTPASEPVPQGGSFIHGLIGLSPGGFSETVRNSISSLTRRDHDANPVPSSTLSSPGTAGSMGATSQAGVDVFIKPEADAESPQPPPAPQPCPRHLLAMPPEILLMVLQRLEFADIVRLRLTCKQLRVLASPHQIRVLFGAERLRRELLGHCRICLLYDPYRRRLLQSSLADPGYPLASRCVDCAVRGRDPRIRVGKKIDMANFNTVWVCRWCGYPIIEGGAFGCEQMHRFCYNRYNDILGIYLVLGCLQFCLGVVAAALAWKYYRDVLLVFAPTVTNFILLWICLAFISFRGTRRRTYHWTLALELAILGLWIPPVYHVATDIGNSPGNPVPKSTLATLAMFFRLINAMGNVVLVIGFDMTTRHRSNIPTWGRPLHFLASAVVIWTYPPVVEQKYPPDYL
ncbi:hypothetical protein VTI28DRAFT_1615 [Corynascus sepedonium]